MAVIHDLRCRRCGTIERNVSVSPPHFGKCVCGGPRTWVPFVPKTDVLGAPTFSIACGREVSSSRERDAIMASKGFVPDGDPVGGARTEFHKPGRTTVYPGQRVRRTAQMERKVRNERYSS